ncbi:hypothetical protein [uncultured Aeromicrobium sp.]|uniref:hypothetical protein n=1 Tax=uncultured Aeromicrobium sp. TaxID=337820 RepID=UPI0025EBBB1F|nr:hypothetical protein [uncultured Aeromicrobium sp.]
MTRPIPESLSNGPFTARQARESGVTEKMLRGKRFVRLLPRVWAVAGQPLTHRQWLDAARLALPERAKLSHLSRIHYLGLELGSREPFHFTVSGDLHLDLPKIFLHRTQVMPPVDDVGVTPAVAFIQACASERLIDLIVIGDWLLHRELMTVEEVLWLVREQPWRPGAGQAGRVVPWLDGRSASPKESEVRTRLVFAGLPCPEPNAPVYDGDRLVGIVDLLYRAWWLALEYEGRQHALDTTQFGRDIERYFEFRALSLAYLQITASMVARPRALVTRVHHLLLERGDDGPAPVFGDRWASLFRLVRGATRQRR